MMKLYHFAKDLELKLNSAITNIDENALTNLNTFLENTRFEFRIFTTSGDYEKAKVEGNTVTYYINGVLRQTSSDKEGITDETYSASISAALDLIVPRCDLFKLDNEGDEYGIYNAVQDLIDDTLRLNEVYSKYDEETNTRYFISIGYEVIVAGVRDIRGQVGDSIPMTVMLNYGIVADGVASSDIRYFIYNTEEDKYERIYPLTVGIARTSAQEGNIPSDSDYSVSYSTTNGSNIVLTIAKNTRFTYLDKRIARYSLLGDNTPLKIKIVYPLDYPPENDPNYETIEKIEKEYNMTFSQSGLNGTEGTAMTSEIILVEELSMED